MNSDISKLDFIWYLVYTVFCKEQIHREEI